jgi:NifU-like protein
MHCSVMGREALEAAIANFEGTPVEKTEGEIVCECFGVTDIQIERVVRENHLTTIGDVTDYVKAGGGCENCHGKIQEIIDSVMEKEPTPKKKKAKLTNIQKIKLIEETLEREIRPALKKDGGNIELIDVDGNVVYVQLRGTCATCRLSEVTLSEYVQAKLRELVTPELVVEEVHP